MFDSTAINSIYVSNRLDEMAQADKLAKALLSNADHAQYHADSELKWKFAITMTAVLIASVLAPTALLQILLGSEGGFYGIVVGFLLVIFETVLIALRSRRNEALSRHSRVVEWSNKVNPYKITLQDVQNLCNIYSGVVPDHVLQMFEEHEDSGTLSYKDLKSCNS